MFFFSWLLGEAKIAFYHAQDTISLLTKGGPQISLAELVKKATPPCWLNPFLFNGHLQTIWASTKHNNPPVSYKRKHFEAENPAFAGTFAVDFVVHEKVETSPGLSNGVANYTEEELQRLGSRDSKPMLICLHGLTGGSHEVYLRHVLYAITTTQDSWEACVINARGCARSKLTTATIFNARATWDLRQLVKWLRQKFPNRPLYAIGFSLGANILTNYVGEEGDDCMLKAAISVANPYNLELCDRQLRSTWIGLHVYTKTLGAAMRKLVSYHREVLSKDGRFDFDKVMATKYLYEFDRELQCPGWGYPTEGAYYRDASSIDAFLAVRIPFLALHAEDDPASKRCIVVLVLLLKFDLHRLHRGLVSRTKKLRRTRSPSCAPPLQVGISAGSSGTVDVGTSSQ